MLSEGTLNCQATETETGTGTGDWGLGTGPGIGEWGMRNRVLIERAGRMIFKD